MNRLDLSRCNFGFVYNGTRYEFEDIDSDIVDNPHETGLTRGMNAKNKSGLEYESNLDQPIIRTQIVKNIPIEIINLLGDIYKKKGRLDIFCIDRIDGTSRISKNAVLKKKPTQLNV